jgi:hypothetical protein
MKCSGRPSAAITSDIRYFNKHPSRRHRIRPALTGEFSSGAGFPALPKLAHGMRWCVMCRWLGPFGIMRVPVQLPVDLHVEQLGEFECASIFDELLGKNVPAGSMAALERSLGNRDASEAAGGQA